MILVEELPVKPGMFSLYGTLDVPWSSDLLQVFRAAAWHCGSWRMGRSWIPAPVCARMRWAEVPVGMRPWQWERGGSEMVKKNEQHVIVDDPTETDLCIFHDILMSTSLNWSVHICWATFGDEARNKVLVSSGIFSNLQRLCCREVLSLKTATRNPIKSEGK